MRTLFPGYFALVMATGIVAIGADQQGIEWLAEPLYWIAVAAYVVLAALYVGRAAGYPKLLFADLTNHARGFAFLTAVAGTNVVAAATIVVRGWWDVAWGLWWMSVVLWAVLVHVTVIAVVIGPNKPGLDPGINGTWFLLTVATQSVAVVAGLLLTRTASDLMAFTALAAFVLGIFLYLVVMTMVFLRWTFQALDPTEADPPAWIAAGAVAISVLAGSNLLVAADAHPRLARTAPAIEALVVGCWATATFWFPLMVGIGVWRHIVRHVPLRYHPSYWAMVFPLGMYGAATFRMRSAIGLAALGWLPKLTLAVAAAAWALAFGGLLHSLIGSFTARTSRATSRPREGATNSRH